MLSDARKPPLLPETALNARGGLVFASALGVADSAVDELEEEDSEQANRDERDSRRYDWRVVAVRERGWAEGRSACSARDRDLSDHAWCERH